MSTKLGTIVQVVARRQWSATERLPPAKPPNRASRGRACSRAAGPRARPARLAGRPTPRGHAAQQGARASRSVSSSRVSVMFRASAMDHVSHVKRVRASPLAAHHGAGGRGSRVEGGKAPCRSALGRAAKSVRAHVGRWKFEGPSPRSTKQPPMRALCESFAGFRPFRSSNLAWLLATAIDDAVRDATRATARRGASIRLRGRPGLLWGRPPAQPHGEEADRRITGIAAAPAQRVGELGARDRGSG